MLNFVPIGNDESKDSDRSDVMYYTIVATFSPILVERMRDYSIKYDDFVFYSVWYKERCLFENTTLAAAREFCSERINQSCKMVFVLNTYIINIRGQYFSRYIDQEKWYRRPHFPWIGFYPIPEKVENGSLLYISLINEFIESEKKGEISLFYKPFNTEKERMRFRRI